MNLPDFLTSVLEFIISFIILLLILLVTREFWCWFFKINERRDLLNEINQKLKSDTVLEINQSQGWICPKCKMENPNYAFTCQHCGFKLK